MRYITHYWHYQSPTRHYRNFWAMLIEKDYNSGRYPQIELTITIYSEEIANQTHSATLYDMKYFRIEDYADDVKGVMEEYGLDFDDIEYQDLVTLLIEIGQSRKVGRTY